MRATPRASRTTDQPEELPRPTGPIRRFWRAHPWLVDSLLAGGYLVIAAFWALVTPLSSGVWEPIGAVLAPVAGVALAAVALLFRRRHPWISFSVLIVIAAIASLSDTAVEPFGLALALYALFVYRSNRSGWIGFAIAATLMVVLLPAISHVIRTGSAPPVAFDPAGSLLLIVLLIAALVGVTVGDRRRYISALLERADQLARERDQQARLATLAERARITREVHDVVAHSLSVMVSLADGAVALAQKDAIRSQDAVREIGDVGRQSLAEMRRLLGALGDEHPDGDPTLLRPNPGLDDLADLFGTFRAARLPVRVETQGNAPSSPALQNAIYRIVQEALTNALRYSREPTDVLVRLDYQSTGTTITVTDDGKAGPAQPSVGSGRGLIGIQERVRLYEGSVETGPRAGGGWRVQAEIPAAKEKE